MLKTQLKTEKITHFFNAVWFIQWFVFPGIISTFQGDEKNQNVIFFMHFCPFSGSVFSLQSFQSKWPLFNSISPSVSHGGTDKHPQLNG